ncbi:MAG TPA: VanW family protein [Polyangiales bacterium]
MLDGGLSAAERSMLQKIALIAAVALLIPLGLWAQFWVQGAPLPGVRVGNHALPRSGSPEKFLESKASLWAEESLRIETGYHVWRPTRAELGAALPVAEVMAQVRELGRSPNPFVSFADYWTGRFGPGHSIRWRARVVDEAALERYVQTIQAEVDRLPIPGSFDPEGKPIEGLPGEALDVEATRRALRAAVASGRKKMTVGTLVTPAPRTYRRFANPTSDASVLMIAQETEYRPGNQGRAINIELAAQKINGQLMMPGAALSFNQVVGKRDAARGFAPAAELMNGEVAQGIGGGVCQVAGTLHAAAFFAGLIVEEYRPHSRLNQFAYLRPGLDTMVAWPDHAKEIEETKDMRIRNPYPFPVMVKATTTIKQPYLAVLRVELYGASRPFRVDWSFEEVGRVDAGEVRRPDPGLARGEEKVSQQPLDGLVIIRRRTIYMPTRRVEEETRVAYPPTPRVILVGTS